MKNTVQVIEEDSAIEMIKAQSFEEPMQCIMRVFLNPAAI